MIEGNSLQVYFILFAGLRQAKLSIDKANDKDTIVVLKITISHTHVLTLLFFLHFLVLINFLIGWDSFVVAYWDFDVIKIVAIFDEIFLNYCEIYIQFPGELRVIYVNANSRILN